MLAELGGGLASLVGQLGIAVEDAVIKVNEGTYDAKAHFDREKSASSQAVIDKMIEGGGEVVSQDDIDALIDG